MPSIITNKPCNYSAEDINRAAELLEASGSDSIDISNIQDKAIVTIANETTPGTLDHADLLKILSVQKNVPQEAIRKALGYPPKDPDGVKLVFEITDYNEHIIANVRIIPDTIKEADNVPCDVFIGGLYHPAPVYLKGAAEFAKRENRELLIFDSVGVGGSTVAKDESINYKMLVRDMEEAIKEKTGYGVRYLMGHSLGSIPVRDLYINYKRDGGERLADIYVPIAFVPAAEEERAGLIMNPLFSLASTPGVLVGKMTPVINRAFFNTHPTEDEEAVRNSTDKQHFNVNLFGFTNILNEVSNRSLLDYIGEDDLILVLGEKDLLMQNHNSAKWERRGVLILNGADHSGIAGNAYAIRSWEGLRGALKERRDIKLPKTEKAGMERRIKPSSGLTAQFGGNLSSRTAGMYAGGFGKISYGLGTWVDWSVGAKVLLGGAVSEFSAPASLCTEFEFIPLSNSRFSIPIGTEVSSDMAKNGALSDFFYLGLRYNMFNIVGFSARVGLLSDISSDPTAEFGGIFNIDLPIPE